jgi:hypothetical protein
MRLRGCAVLLLSLTWPQTTSASLDDWCTSAEQLGEVPPTPACSARVALMVEVTSVALPCWQGVPEDLPLEDWLAARELCEMGAHLSVCGQVPCY